MEDAIVEKLKRKEKESDLYDRCISQDICPECGGNLEEDSDIGRFIEVECNSCDFSYTKKGYGYYS